MASSLQHHAAALFAGYRPPAPEAWLPKSLGFGEVEAATGFPLLHTPRRPLSIDKDRRATLITLTGTKDRADHVDGDEIVAGTLAMIFQSQGYSAESFVDPLYSLEVASAGPPDLLIANVSLLVISGLELALMFSARWPKYRIGLISEDPTAHALATRAQRQGYQFHIISPPIRPAVLLSQVADQLRIKF